MRYDYDLAVIGAGTGGLVSAFVADALGARVALIEGDKVGGECLWRGCVPSKTLLKSAKVFEMVKRSAEFGVHVEKPRLVWNAVKLRLSDVRDEVRHNERAELNRSKIEIVSGQARFTGAHHLAIQTPSGPRPLSARKFIVATGSRPVIPAIEGLEEAGFLTYEGLFERNSLPKSLAFIGGGPIAVEMAQAFARFGSKVTIIGRGERLLEKEEPSVSALIEKILRAEGVEIHLGAHIARVEDGDGRKTIHFEQNGASVAVPAGQIVVTAGKTPRFAALNLEAAGVATSAEGIAVNAQLRTSAPHIWACGDVTGKFLFTHAAEYEAKIAAQNALLPVKAKVDYRALPWVTFTDPEIAHLGQTEAQARAQHGAVRVWQTPFGTLDRAIIEGETAGFARLVTTRSGRIVGAHIIGPSAGEVIASFVPAVREGALLQEFAETVFPYPTLAEIGHRAGNEIYQETLNSKWVRAALKLLVRQGT